MIMAFFCQWSTGDIVLAVTSVQGARIERNIDGVILSLTPPTKPATFNTVIKIDGRSYPAKCHMEVL